MESTTEFSTPLAHGVWAIDTGYQRANFDAAYLVVERGRAAFIDTGTGHSVPRLLAVLEAAGVARDAVDWVIPTHVHLDHAGGSGALMAALPNARLVVHPLGARHLIDPSRLIAGASAVYGADEVQRSIGTVLPVSAERVLESADGMEIDLAGRPLRLLDTPGHARHHHCVWDERSRGVFTGDTFGLSYREFDTPQGAWLLPSTTPVQFDPPALRHSFERLLALRPDCVYLTHFGRLPATPGPDNADTLQQLGRDYLEQLDAVIALGERTAAAIPDAEERHVALVEGLGEIYLERVQRLAGELPRERVLELLDMDIELNAQGMGVWLASAAAKPATPTAPAPAQQPRNPLHGLRLEDIVTALVAHYGWAELGALVPVRCFISDPSVASSLKFLRKTPWAREKVEGLYLFMLRDVRRAQREAQASAAPPRR
jgi:glyoxylase-like metal-dependent hydrolase (beta-lactamase superfamily II)